MELKSGQSVLRVWAVKWSILQIVSLDRKLRSCFQGHSARMQQSQGSDPVWINHKVLIFNHYSKCGEQNPWLIFLKDYSQKLHVTYYLHYFEGYNLAVLSIFAWCTRSLELSHLGKLKLYPHEAPSPHSPFPQPLVATFLLFVSKRLTTLDTSQESNHTVFVFFRLTISSFHLAQCL